MSDLDQSTNEDREKLVLSILDQIKDLKDLEKLVRIEQIKVNQHELHSLVDIDEFFENHKERSEDDLMEFKKQINIQKQIYLSKIKRLQQQSKSNPQEPTTINQIFGKDIALVEGNSELVSKMIQKRKEEYIKQIRMKTTKDKGSSSFQQKEKTEVIPEIEELEKEKQKNTSPARVQHEDVDVFAKDLHNMDIVRLKMELNDRKSKYYDQLKDRSIETIANDISYLSFIIDILSESQNDVANYKPRFVYRRVRKRVMSLKMKTLKEYLAYLKTNSEEIEILKGELSICVTSFVRDRKTWDFLRSTLLPNLIRERKGGSIQFWSAAAAIGAEAYSIAILMDQINHYNFKIIASDINPKLISQARKGTYNRFHIRELNDLERVKYFEKILDKQGQDAYVVDNKIKKNVNFKQIDLLADPFPSNIDVIFARNIWIYFNEPDPIFMKMYHSLNPGGYLILGGTEQVPNAMRKYFKVEHSRHQIYKRVDFTE
ncbi:MAG: protein-glutamate O-methyltransferase CheR [Candidatus Heimdallarchaeota archaeon]|nr:protein-glutamate O-methyltransferase CheR [Candidatus Heimdallarchaeota archaeon]